MPLDLNDDKSILVQVMAWHQAITWANVDPDLCHHMVSLGHNELNQFKTIDFQTYVLAQRHHGNEKPCEIKLWNDDRETSMFQKCKILVLIPDKRLLDFQGYVGTKGTMIHIFSQFL